ncbi:MAG: peptidoglycan-binding protein [Patescibacteria group bacterium]|nr:peptidoglycan-binding protein [Patescibacteria group bacterium]MDE1965669.1 peptidoglycan-binding protein [Patescibacteria group bacterium]
MIRTVSFPVRAALLVSIVFGFASFAFAAVPPSLSLSATGSGDNVQVNVYGDPNSSVLLSYTESGSGPTIVVLGSTDANGNYSSVLSSASYGLVSGTAVTAIVGGTGGPKSQTVSWPTVTSANALTLSQDAVVLSVGSSSTVTANTIGSAALYVSNNSNPSIANVSISGSQATIAGVSSGSTTITLCQVGNTANCPSVYVTVEQAGAGQLSFSQNNVTVVSGQNLPLTVSGGNGAYQILRNSNASTIQASLSGSVLTLSTGASTGSSSITLCSTDMAACGVVVASAGSASSVAITFSNSAPVVSTNESATVAIYGPSGVQFYVSSNSNPSIVQANLSGTSLTLTGLAAGTSSVAVCASTGTCANLSVTVQYVATGGNITLGQTTLSLLAGQNSVLTVSGGEQPYTVMGGTSSVSQETLSGGSLTVYGVAAGTSSVNVCSSGGGCVPLDITVSGGGTSAALSTSRSSVSLSVGGNAAVALYGNGSYYLSGNTASNVASASVSGANLYLTGLAAGNTSVTVCASGSVCATIPVTVAAASVTPPEPPSAASGGYTFTEYLSPGKQDAEVTELQKMLAAEGYLTVAPTGYYGTLTENAVLAFQKAKGITQLGVVGPATRAALNTIAAGANAVSSGSANAVGTPIASMTLSQLQAEVQLLQSELTQALTRIAQLTAH